MRLVAYAPEIVGGELQTPEYQEVDGFGGRLMIERRRVPRKAFNEAAMAVFSTGLNGAALSAVRIVDASHIGLGLMSPVPAEPGTSVSLLPDSPMWPRQTGIVVRCVQNPDGTYHLGLLSKRRTAAA